MLFTSSRKPWFFLAAAIVLEVAGTSAMKLALAGSIGLTRDQGVALMLLFVMGSYYCLSLAIRRLPVGVAYACWEGLGLALITLISIVVLGDAMTSAHAFALGAVVLGAILIRRGMPRHEETDKETSHAASCPTPHHASLGDEGASAGLSTELNDDSAHAAKEAL